MYFARDSHLAADEIHYTRNVQLLSQKYTVLQNQLYLYEMFYCPPPEY